MKKVLILTFTAACYSAGVLAQHTHHHLPESDTTAMNGSMPAMPDSMPHHPATMSHAFSRNLPMNRNGSGTGWLPDAAPMYGVMYHSRKWMYMLHGNLFGRYNSQDFTNRGSRGASKWDAPNWVMFMGQRLVGKRGLFRFNTMFSLDAVIVGGSGYPLLFQTGESYRGRPLIDRQHPHDLFSELSLGYTHSFSKKTDAFIYIGYPGEPAIGPVAFMHRPSALYNPDAPLSHHWSDATHITFGVATIGLRHGRFKLEGSSFTGREPNEKRFDFDKPRFDSWSGRLSFNPNRHWALQVSHAYIKGPEDLHPGENVRRTTAAATYSLPLARDGWFNLAAVYGLNKYQEQAGENAALLEASWRHRRLAVYSRYEFVQKTAEELDLDETVYGHHSRYPVHALTLGAGYDLLEIRKLRLAAGAQLTRFAASSRLNPLYGANPMAFQVYLRLYPGLMKM